MSTKLTRVSALSGLVLSVALMGGCATTSDLAETRAMAEDARASASQAQRDASQARTAADAATRTANEARNLATEANRKAESALEENAKLKETMERMYERGPAK
jgi:type VI protein secretion system component VasK